MYAYANPYHTTTILYGMHETKRTYTHVCQKTLYNKTREAREKLKEERINKVLSAFKENMSVHRVSQLTGLRWHFCKKILLERGLIRTAESTYKKLYDFYIVDLPNRTKTQEIRQAEIDYVKDGNDLLYLIGKCEKEKTENSTFKKAYKQYKFQNEVLGKKKSINRLSKICGFGNARTKKIAERLGFVL